MEQVMPSDAIDGSSSAQVGVGEGSDGPGERGRFHA